MAAAAQPAHDVAHIDALGVAAADDHALVLVLEEKNAERRVGVHDIAKHAHDDRKAFDVALDAQSADTDGVAVDLLTSGTLKHFEKHVFLFFAISQTQKAVQYSQIRALIQQIGRGAGIFSGGSQKTQLPCVFIQPGQQQSGLNGRHHRTLGPQASQHQGDVGPHAVPANP